MYRRVSDVVRGGTRERIVRAASQMFASRGFAATTTRDIARLAGLNEALVFYYFGRKRNLYWAVLEESRQESRFVEGLRKRLKSRGDPETVIAELCESIVLRHERDDTLFRLLLLTGLQHGKDFQALSRRFFKTHLHTSYDVVADYVRKQIRAGRFRKVDPMLASRALFSLVGYHHVIQEFMGGKHARRYPPKPTGRMLAQLWVQALTVEAKKTSVSPRKRSSKGVSKVHPVARGSGARRERP